jgi:hypothetical protein
MKLRTTVTFDQEVTDDPQVLNETYGTTVPTEVADNARDDYLANPEDLFLTIESQEAGVNITVAPVPVEAA